MDTDRRAHVAQLVMAQQDRAARAEVAAARAKYLYIEPPVSAALDLIDVLSNVEERFMFGLPELDMAMRGVGRGELCYLTGRAHAGKTLLVQNALLRQPERRILYFTPDETKAKVQANLVSLVHGTNYEEMEQAIRAGDPKVARLIRATSTEHFPNLILCEQALTFAEMTVAKGEAEDFWQGTCDTVIVDYLDLLPGPADYHGTKRKSVELKGWTKQHRVGMVCVHQPARGGAARGTSIGMDDMANAGETEATYVLGVHRERDNERADEEHRMRHVNTVSVTLSKNKRPPAHHGTWTFFMHPTTGRIRQLHPDDLLVPGVELDMRSALAMRERAQAEQAKPLLHVVG